MSKQAINLGMVKKGFSNSLDIFYIGTHGKSTCKPFRIICIWVLDGTPQDWFDSPEKIDAAFLVPQICESMTQSLVQVKQDTPVVCEVRLDTASHATIHQF